MRILAMGNFGTEYVRDSWKQPLTSLYSTVWVNAAPLMAHGDYRYTYCQRYIHSLIRDDHFDFFYFYSDGLKDAFPDEFFNAIRAAGLPIITFHADDEPEVWYKRNRPFEHHYDLVATHSKRGWQKRQEEGTGPEAIYLPWAFNPTYYYKIPELTKIKKYDIVFIGKYKETGVTAIADEDGKQRKDVLIKIFEICKQNGLIFKIFGVGWERHPVLSEVYGGILDQKGMVEIYNQTKVVFNPGFSADDSNTTGYQTKLRHFEVPGCGAMQLCNTNPELAELFAEDKEIIFYNNDDELEEKILFYIRQDNARETVAEAGYNRALTQHTTAHRLTHLFDYAQKLFLKSHPITVDQPKLKIGQLPINMFQSILDEIIDNRGINHQAIANQINTQTKEYEWIQLKPEPNQTPDLDFNTDYESIRGILHNISKNKQVEALSVRSVIKFLVKGSNYIQEDWRNFSGFILTPDTFKPGYEIQMQKHINELFNPIFIDNEPIFLFNYLIRPAALKKVLIELTLKKEDTIHPFNALIKAHSHRIVNEILIKEPKEIQYSQRKMKQDSFFANLSALGKSLMIYGASGYPIPGLMELINRYNIKFLGFIDRALAGKEVQGKPVYSREELEKMKPEVIIVSPETSGPAIFQSLSSEQSKSQIIPLYDITDESWNV